MIIALYAALYERRESKELSIEELAMAARSSQKIDSTWQEVEDSSECIGAMLFYSDDKTDHIYSIYLKEDAYADYQFSEGGSLGEIQRNVVEIDYGKQGSVLLSMNEQHIRRIELQENEDVKVIAVEDGTPFVVVISGQADKVTLFDDNGEEVKIHVIT